MQAVSPSAAQDHPTKPEARWSNTNGGVFDHAVTAHAVKGGDPTTDNYVTHSLRPEGADASEDGTGRGTPLTIMPTMRSGTPNGTPGGRAHSRSIMTPAMAVRRLTPEECEALMGFERLYTKIIYRSKPAKDSPRYRALGNSMAVPCLKWILKRLRMVDKIKKGLP